MELTATNGAVVEVKADLNEFKKQVEIETGTKWPIGEDEYFITSIKQSSGDGGSGIVLSATKRDGTDTILNGANIVLNTDGTDSYINFDADAINFDTSLFAVRDENKNVLLSAGKGKVGIGGFEVSDKAIRSVVESEYWGSGDLVMMPAYMDTYKTVSFSENAYPSHYIDKSFVYVGIDGIGLAHTSKQDTDTGSAIIDKQTWMSGGYLYSNSGEIGGWSISAREIRKDNTLLSAGNGFGVPTLKTDFFSWAHNSIVRFAAGKRVSTDGQNVVCKDYYAGGTVTFGVSDATPTYTNTKAIYLQLPFWSSEEDFNAESISFELSGIRLMWSIYSYEDEYLNNYVTDGTGYIDVSQLSVTFSVGQAAIIIPAGAIHTNTSYSSTKNVVRLECGIRVKFNEESMHYLSAPFIVTDDGEVLSDQFCTIDGSVIVTSTNFERNGVNGSRVEFESDVWKWRSDAGSLGVQTGSAILDGFVHGSFCSDIFTFYPMSHADNFSKDIFGNKCPSVELFKRCTFIGANTDSYAHMTPDIAIKANGLWNFSSKVYFDGDVSLGKTSGSGAVRLNAKNVYFGQDSLVGSVEFANATTATFNGTVQFKGTVKDSSGTTIHTSDYNAKNSIKDQPVLYSQLFDKLRPVIFKYNGGTSDRYHTGLIAQDIENAMIDLGIDSKDFAALCYEQDEDGNKYDYGIRYVELVSMCIQEIQNLKMRVSELENELQIE